MIDALVQNHFRSTLRNELVRRCRANPRYSQRAYARALGVESAFLSKLLAGERSITLKSIEKFSPHLGLSASEVASLSPSAEPNFHSLSHDSFLVISEWYYFAILELFTVEGFQPRPRYIAKRLGLSQAIAQDALLRFERLGLIEKDKKTGFALKKGENTTTNHPDSSSALRKMQRQILEQAIGALENTPIALRDQSTITMAIDDRLLPQAKEALKKFRRQFCKNQQGTGKRNSVYQLSLSFYPVTQGETS